MRFSFNMKYVPGKSLVMADVLSRSPCKETTDERSADPLTVDEVRAYAEGVLMGLPQTVSELDKIRQAQANDDVRENTSFFRKDRLAW